MILCSFWTKVKFISNKIVKFKKTSFGTIDSYKYFIELGFNLTKSKGCLSYIMPDSYIEKEYFKDVRTLVSNSFKNVFKNLYKT